MAVANTKSLGIIAQDSGLLTNALQIKTIAKVSPGVVEVIAGDDNNSVYRFCRLPSNARVTNIEVLNDAITVGTDYDFGLYNTAANGGLEPVTNSSKLFADTVTMASARVAPLDVRHFTSNIATKGLMLWELLGFTVDPVTDYDLCATGATVGTSDGTIAVETKWTTQV